jgi:hypothetical protein
MITQNKLVAKRSPRTCFLYPVTFALCTCAFCSRNWCGALYTCRESSTNQTLLCKTKPICKNAKQPQTYACKGLMKQLPRKTAEKTKPICKNEKTNLTPCLKMTYEEKYPLRRPEKQTQSNPISKSIGERFSSRSAWRISVDATDKALRLRWGRLHRRGP